MKRTTAWKLAVAAATLCPGAAWGIGQGEGQFAALHAPDVRQVKATLDAEDDLALADRFLDIAANGAPRPAYLVDLCNGAFDLASPHENGRSRAIQAMRFMAQSVKGTTLAAAEKLVPIYEQMYKAAEGADRARLGRELVEAAVAIADHKLNDEAAPGAELLIIFKAVQSAVKHFELAAQVAEAEGIKLPAAVLDGLAVARHRAQALDEARTLNNKMRYSSNPIVKVESRTDLARLYLIDMDDPYLVLRQKCIEGAGNAAEQALVRMAAGSPKPTTEAQWLDLADWYAQLSRKAKGAAKQPIVNRAVHYYQRFLDVHAANDAARGKAQHELALLEGNAQPLEVAPLEAAAPPVAPPKVAVAPKPAPRPVVRPRPVVVAPAQPHRPDEVTYTRPKIHLPPADPARPRGFFGLPYE